MNGAYLSFYNTPLSMPICAFVPIPAGLPDCPSEISNFCNYSQHTLYYPLSADYLGQGNSYYLGQPQPNTYCPSPFDSFKTDSYVKLEEPSGFLSAWNCLQQENSNLPVAPCHPNPKQEDSKPATSDCLSPKPSPPTKKPIKRAVSGDRDYLPHKTDKKTSRRRSHQNQNRNVIPNQINQIVSFVQKRNKSGHLLEKIMRRFPPASASFTLSRFYLYQAMLKQKIGHYTNERSLKHVNQLYEPECRVWTMDEQRYYNTICRVLIRHFLQEDSIFIILTSKRMKSQKKLDHLRARRELVSSVLRILKEG